MIHYIRVTPNASSNRIVEDVQEDGRVILRVYVTVIAEDGKANKAVLKLLSKYLGVPKTSLNITHGQTSRNKTVRVDQG